MNRPESPCHGDGHSEAKEVRDNTAKGYLHGIDGEIECPNVNDIPCMIPQAKDLLTSEEQKSLNQCSTLLQYNSSKVIEVVFSGALNCRAHEVNHKHCCNIHASLNT